MEKKTVLEKYSVNDVILNVIRVMICLDPNNEHVNLMVPGLVYRCIVHKHRVDSYQNQDMVQSSALRAVPLARRVVLVAIQVTLLLVQNHEHVKPITLGPDLSLSVYK